MECPFHRGNYEVFLQTGKSLLYWQQQKTKPTFDSANFKTLFLMPPRQEVYNKSDARIIKMLEKGLLDEMQNLQKMNVDINSAAMRAHGIREFLAYIDGSLTIKDAIEKAQQSTRNYVKRQFTWFRHQMPQAIIISDANGAMEQK